MDRNNQIKTVFRFLHVGEAIDRIDMNRLFVTDAKIDLFDWNLDKRLSDHKSVAVGYDGASTASAGSV
jgi:hypothetical protein